MYPSISNFVPFSLIDKIHVQFKIAFIILRENIFVDLSRFGINLLPINTFLLLGLWKLRKPFPFAMLVHKFASLHCGPTFIGCNAQLCLSVISILDSCTKGIGTKGIGIKGIVTKGMIYKMYRQHDVSATQGFGNIRYLSTTKGIGYKRYRLQKVSCNTRYRTSKGIGNKRYQEREQKVSASKNISRYIVLPLWIIR